MRRILPYVTVAMILSICYAAWVVLSRRQANQDIERSAEQRKADANRKVVDQLGGGELKILNFYPTTGAVHRGEKALICFSVASAKQVDIEPEIGDIPPSLSRCVEVHPAKTTEYKLTARDAQGHSATQSFQLLVK
jgi:hypothetical protein